MPGFIGSRKHNAVYLNMPKAACTTIKNYLYYMDHGKYHPSPLDIHKYTDDVFLTYDRNRGDIYKKFHDSAFFTFVRHPIRRVYSLFNEKIVNQWEYSFPDVRNMLINAYGAQFGANDDVETVRANFIKFLYFIRDTKEERIQFRRDHHWMPQSFVLSLATRIRPMDFIGKVENFDRDFRYVLARSGFNDTFELKKFNEGPGSKVPYEQVANDEVKNLGYAIYSRDFENFGYRHE
jgi:hypothetical protein